ncbi:MAG TPA: dienelactone hydrolase family protein [Mucilaginibacter sp.]
MRTIYNDEVRLPVDDVVLYGQLAIPDGAEALVIFAHGTGSSRFSPRNQYVAERLQQRGYATLLFDLLTNAENQIYFNSFEIDLLASRLISVTNWATAGMITSGMIIGYFGASTGAAAALIAAAELPDKVLAVVSRGGRPDLTGDALEKVHAAVLLLVGGLDTAVIDLNRQAMDQIDAPSELTIVPEATHLFEEPGKLDEVADYALEWFSKYLKTEVPL